MNLLKAMHPGSRLRIGDSRARMNNPFGSRDKQGPKTVWITVACLLAVALTGLGCNRQDQAVKWGYDGPGAPEHWASLSDEYAACDDGTQQSPIDIADDIAGYDTDETPPISFSYASDAVAVRNDGRFVHIDYAGGNTLSVGPRSYKLKSAHLHSPSEHRVDGTNFAAEMHLVHADADGNLAVVGLLFKLGAHSPVVQAILDAAPNPGDTVGTSFILNTKDYVPAELGYYRYDGSKTTPPCDEPVEWYVMRHPKTVSQEQVDDLLALSGGPTDRPVQPIGARVIAAR